MLLEFPITSKNLILKNLINNDVNEIYLRWLFTPEINQHMEVRFTAPSSLIELSRFVEGLNSSSDNLLLGIFLRHDMRHIGNIKIGPISRHHKSAEIGIMIGDKNEWGKGYASEAIVAVKEYAFKNLSLIKLTAGCYAENIGSLRAFIKAGFVEEGRKISQYVVDGKRQDGLILGIVNDIK